MKEFYENQTQLQHITSPISEQFHVERSRCPELVKVAGVAPTELQELGGGSQSQPTT